MFIVIARTLILYIAVIGVIRIMGKRQIGELQPYELAITIMISALAAIPMEDIGIPLLYSLIPILLLLSFQELISLLTLKSSLARAIICGTPTVLIENGKIREDKLKKLRININDLLEQLRIKGYNSIENVEFALIETNGQISVIPKSQKRPLTPADLNIETNYEGIPTSLIIDGQILEENLKSINLDKNWLEKKLAEFNLHNEKEVFFAALNNKGEFIFQEKKKGG